MDRRRFFMKDFKLVTEQVDLLKSRGMLFEDEQDAICKLLSDNYYNIINGYKDLFLDTTNNQEVFKTGTTFNEIYALYEFDNQLKNIFLEYILKIENILRTQVAYHFSSFHGNDNYLKIDNFDTFSYNTFINPNLKEKQIKHIQLLISNLNKKIADSISSTKYINHYIMNYGFIPLWVLVNILSFGDICNFYKLMNQNERIHITMFWGISDNDLKSFLGILCHTRNLCAHNERLFNYSFPTRETISDTNYHNLLNIPSINNRFQYGKNDLFAVMIVLKTLLTKEDYQKFHSKIYSRLKSIESKIKTISLNDILVAMNFPYNWHSLLKMS